MGSMIRLRLGRLEVDWGKNNFFTNHSPLFRATDLQEADYYYADDVVERKPAYVRKLRHVTPRLELLGFSLEGCRRASLPSRAAPPPRRRRPAPASAPFPFRRVLPDGHCQADRDAGRRPRRFRQDGRWSAVDPKLA